MRESWASDAVKDYSLGKTTTSRKDVCHCLIVLDQAVLFDEKLISRKLGVGAEFIEVLPQAKVAIIAPLDEHRSRTHHLSISMLSKIEFKRGVCFEVMATLESFPTHARHAKR